MSVCGLVTEKMAYVDRILIRWLNMWRAKRWKESLQVICIQTTYYRKDMLVPVWKSKAIAPDLGWGNSLLASSQQESRGHFPDHQLQFPGNLSHYCSLQASDALPRGWDLRGNLQIPFSLLVCPAERATRRRVQSSARKLFLAYIDLNAIYRQKCPISCWFEAGLTNSLKVCFYCSH